MSSLLEVCSSSRASDSISTAIQETEDGRQKQSVTTCPLYEHPLFLATTQNNVSIDAITMPPIRSFVDGNPSTERWVLDEHGSRMLRVSAVLEV